MIRKILLTMFAGTFLATSHAQSTNQTPLVYIIPIKKMIEPALLYVCLLYTSDAADDL